MYPKLSHKQLKNNNQTTRNPNVDGLDSLLVEFEEATQAIYNTMLEHHHLPLQTVLERARLHFSHRFNLPSTQFEAF